MIARLMFTLALIVSLVAIIAPAPAPADQPVVRLVADQSTAGHWYIVQNKEGTTRVVDKKPGLGWEIVGGPYSGWDQAARAGGVAPYGTGSAQPYQR